MSDTPFWNEDWMQLQQKYWEQWGEMSRKAMGMQPPKSPWENAMENWWSAVAPATDKSTRAFMDKMMDQGRSFFQFNEELSRNAAKGKDWLDTANQALEKLQENFAAAAEQTSEAGKNSFSRMAGFWEGPMESWRNAAGPLPMNNDLARTPKLFEQLLGMPGLGFSREDEENYRELAQSWLDYQHALTRYNHFFADVGTAAMRCVKCDLDEIQQAGKKIDSGRDLYNTWVGACEKVYAEHTMTPEYSKVHGDLVNALMGFKKKWRELQDQRLGMLGMPTRREVQTLQTRLQESRRELRSLSCQVELLKEQVAALRSPSGGSPSGTEASAATAPAATVKKKVTRKKATRKKAAAK